MLVVMRHGASDDEIRQVVRVIEEMGYRAHPLAGKNRTAIGVIGNEGRVDSARISGLAGVQDHIQVTPPYKQVSREWKPESSIVRLPGGLTIGGDDVVVMAGPCSVESEAQLMAAATAVRESRGNPAEGGSLQTAKLTLFFPGPGEARIKAASSGEG